MLITLAPEGFILVKVVLVVKEAVLLFSCVNAAVWSGNQIDWRTDSMKKTT